MGVVMGYFEMTLSENRVVDFLDTVKIRNEYERCAKQLMGRVLLKQVFGKPGSKASRFNKRQLHVDAFKASDKFRRAKWKLKNVSEESSVG